MGGGDLEARFDAAMRDISARAVSECGYRPGYFLRMVEELGGLGAARALLAKPAVSEGFTKLALLGQLDLTMEALVLEPKWAPLFTDEERKIARRRLRA